LKLTHIWLSFIVKHGFTCTAMSPSSPQIKSMDVLLIQKFHLHDVKIGMWCALNATKITPLMGPYSMKKQSRWTCQTAISIFLHALCRRRIIICAVSAGFSNFPASDILTALKRVKRVFGDRTTGYSLCLACLTDLSVHIFYFWGHVKHKVYRMNRHA